MTQTFAAFTGPAAVVYFPGAAFVVAGLLSVIAMGVFLLNLRQFAPAPLPGGT